MICLSCNLLLIRHPAGVAGIGNGRTGVLLEEYLPRVEGRTVSFEAADIDQLVVVDVAEQGRPRLLAGGVAGRVVPHYTTD